MYTWKHFQALPGLQSGIGIFDPEPYEETEPQYWL